VVFTDFTKYDLELLEKELPMPLNDFSARYSGHKFDGAIFKTKMPPWKPQYPNPADSQGVKK